MKMKMGIARHPGVRVPPYRCHEQTVFSRVKICRGITAAARGFYKLYRRLWRLRGGEVASRGYRARAFVASRSARGDRG